MIEKILTTLVDKELDDKRLYQFVFTMWKLLKEKDPAFTYEEIEFLDDHYHIDL